ncbi:sensor histidine kinase [Mucilaginibacter gotjawali]|uniref:Sensor histidine kinase YehU n=2 Tax=Mucilaginibacter gotjawali TaxID=1550579 RepID=A0A120MZ90_9SPHI|nr:histidine kinase [Mucilaginibacter gotjawali]MBB3058687.1 sensor histidine kinase YesM [Mucilaginibacter gotjawali]BAU55843.1 Sensor histidine kinase YehU [Mucilaginibacter gotjawali]
MKIFRKYIFPPLYGLLIYFTVRLLHDTDIGLRFWKRTWSQNTIEIMLSLIVGYAGVYLFERLFKYYDQHWPLQFRYQNVVRELAIMVGLNLVLVNLVFTPWVIIINGRLFMDDLADICTIPSLYTIVYYGIARARTYMMAYVDNRVLLEKVTNDHLETELKFLKSQYHPHFLFNALNTIYFQMDDDLPGAKNSIEKFSELLRYQLYDQQQQVPVKNEMEYLQSFIDLQKIRSSDRLKLNVSIDEKLDGQMVYPLLFLPLVENAFKFLGGDYKLAISAGTVNNKIHFRVENSVPEFETPATRKGGIGLENLKRRLDLLYPGRHIFFIKKEHNNFTAELTLNYE